MTLHKLQYEWRSTTGLNRDSATNTLYIDATNLTAVEDGADAIAARLQVASESMSEFMVVETGGLRVKAYDMTDPEPREPVYAASYNTNPAALAAMPTEVAIVISYRGQYDSGIPQASRRGRFYIPFLTETNNGTDGRPDATIIAAMVAVGQGMLDDSQAASTWKWVQYSPKFDHFEMVEAGFVDNEWDTQRRRGRRATSRTTFS